MATADDTSIPFQFGCPPSELNNIAGSINSCSGMLEYGAYGYNVSRWSAILFVTLFAFTTLLHTAQAVRGRIWWMLPTICIAGAVECLGWAGRLWSSVGARWSPFYGGYFWSPSDAFLMQISTLIFAPAFLAAFWYICLGRIIRFLGPQYCRFNAKTYTIVFIIGDLISLCVQAAGGGIASAAEDDETSDLGARIMIGGIVFQVVVMALYSVLLAEVVYRYYKKKPVKQFRIRKTRDLNMDAANTPNLTAQEIRKIEYLVAAMVFSTLLIFIRSIYRVIELAEGWTGPIITREDLFIALDGFMVFLAILVFNFAHPKPLFPKHHHLNKASRGDSYPLTHDYKNDLSKTSTQVTNRV